MGIVNAAALAAMFKSFSVIFNETFTGVAPAWQRVAVRVPSGGSETLYGWLKSLPKMREWLGDRQFKNLEVADYTIKNKNWESTFEVDRNDIEDDQIGVYRPVVAELARAAAVHPDEIVFALLTAGFTALCHDGQYFFDTDHPVGDGVVSNHGGGASTPWFLLDTTRMVKPLVFQSRRDVELVSMDKPNDENVFMRRKLVYGVDCRDNAGYGLWQLAYGSKQTLNADNYAAAREAMMSMLDDHGKPLGITPNLLVVPPSLDKEAREILLVERLASGATNTYKNTADLLTTAWAI